MATTEGPTETTSMVNQGLNVGASVMQNFDPVNQICAHLYAYHIYASDQTRWVAANHYCSQLNDDMRQCLIYDSPDKSARLIGIEYLISPKLYETLPSSERKLWHSHLYEVKSGLLVMPPGKATPSAVMDKAELTEMEEVVTLYGKTYHLWQVDRGDQVPMGEPQLMGAFTSDESMDKADPNGKQALFDKTKETFGIDSNQKAEMRKGLCPDFKVHPDADSMCKK